MKRIGFIFLLALASLEFTNAQSLSGEYVGALGKVVIDNKHFYYIEPATHLWAWHNDTLARCTIKQIDKKWIELNSVDPVFADFEKDIKITQSHDSTYNDGILLNFIIPYDRKPYLRISVSDDKMATRPFTFIYSDTIKSVLLPPGTRSFDFTIAPEGYSPHTVEGAYYGILYITSLTYKIKPACNKVIIELPRLTDSFFEQYYVKGDYARIQRNSLFWRGVEYKKKHKYNKQYLK